MELPNWIFLTVFVGLLGIVVLVFGQSVDEPVEIKPLFPKKNTQANLDLAKVLGWKWDDWLYAWVKGGRIVCYAKDLPDFQSDVNLIHRELESLGLHWWIGKLGPGKYQAWVGETDPKIGEALVGSHPALALCLATSAFFSEPLHAKPVRTGKRRRKTH